MSSSDEKPAPSNGLGSEKITTLDQGPATRDGRPIETASLHVALCGHSPLSGSSRHLLRGVNEVLLGRGDALMSRRQRADGRLLLRVELPDEAVSTAHARLMPGKLGHLLLDLDSRNGTRVNGVETRSVTLTDGAVIEIGATVLCYRNPVHVPGEARADLLTRDLPEPHGLDSLAPRATAVMADLRRVARSSIAVLLGGEPGSGKQIVARTLHALSRRTGAFTAVRGADVHDGLAVLAAAQHGTLFIDEPAELPAAAQALLAQAADVRFVSATQKDLAALAKSGRLREDLVARLAGFAVALPSLRHRREDLGMFVAMALASGQRPAPLLGPRAVRALWRYSFPRNIQELEQALHHATAQAADGYIGLEHLPETVAAAAGVEVLPGEALPLSLDSERKSEILRLLVEHAGNLTRVAEVMGKKRQQIQKWCRRYDIDPKRYR
jgi:hypothetical protein